MSGPYCKDCKHWEKMIRSEEGECKDPSKVIFVKYGDRKNEPPITSPTDTCSNWEATSAMSPKGAPSHLKEVISALADPKIKTIKLF